MSMMCNFTGIVKLLNVAKKKKYMKQYYFLINLLQLELTFYISSLDLMEELMLKQDYSSMMPLRPLQQIIN